VFSSFMPKLATWLRPKDEKWFQPFFDRAPQIQICNALTSAVDVTECDGLLLTGGADIAPELLRQPVPDAGLIDSNFDAVRDAWELGAVPKVLERGLPVFGICKGMQVLNVALGGTLKLDIPGHNAPEQKSCDIQPLRNDLRAQHRFDYVNSSHHQAVDSLGAGLAVEAWCESDDIIEQVRLRREPFAVGVQYHPERGRIYDALFDDFFAHVTCRKR
jgi:putative glutamine amidotransferase